MKPSTFGSVSKLCTHNGELGGAHDVIKTIIQTVNIIWIKLRLIKSKIIISFLILSLQNMLSIRPLIFSFYLDREVLFLVRDYHILLLV
ncbi:uncharacterized protein METZ01_LOCUS65584 [marine metagenome]|uniref:Uncharacterized protein n=1 Tax=marine metagenome TaxID=408172 RepID=A0A381T969_9ZZZZ